MKTLNSIEITEADLLGDSFNYQPKLTEKLDNTVTNFNQEIINEIVLWKVNRYSEISSDVLNLINQIKHQDTEINNDLTKKILQGLLNCKGIRLAMASTILRFKNPKIYQIIDQRVYRFIYGSELKYSFTDIDKQIELYLEYLDKLKLECKIRNIVFEKSDRIIYEMDKKYNKKINIKY
jgi:hypothetical protein